MMSRMRFVSTPPRGLLAEPSRACRFAGRWPSDRYFTIVDEGIHNISNALGRRKRRHSQLRARPASLGCACQSDGADSFRVLIAAGGTGGHVYPAVAIAEALRARPSSSAGPGETVQVRFAGTRERLEWGAAHQAGFAIDSVPAVSLTRPLLSFANLLLPLRLAIALLRAIQLVVTLRPHVILGTGGYVSFPTCLAGWLLRRPVVLQEQNALPGLANRVLSRLASLVCLGIPLAASAQQHLPKRVRTVVTGNPIRESLTTIRRAEARRRLELSPQQRLVVVMGGSLGSGVINTAMAGAAPELLGDPTVVILWAAGMRFFEDLSAQLAPHHRIRLVPYLHDMGAVYAAAEVVVGRAGAITCSELMATGSAALLVPLPSAVDDHQMKNAEYLVSQGAAVVLKEGELCAHSLAETVQALLGDVGRLAKIRKSAAALAPAVPAAEHIASLIIEVADKTELRLQR